MDGHLQPPGAGGGGKPPSRGLPEGAQPCPVPISDLRPPGRRGEALLQPSGAQLSGLCSAAVPLWGFLGERRVWGLETCFCQLEEPRSPSARLK